MCLNLFKKKMEKPSFFPSLFQSSRPISSFSFFSLSTAAQTPCRPSLFPFPGPSPCAGPFHVPFSPLSLPAGPTCQVFLPPRARLHRCRWVSPAPLSAGGPPFKLGPLAGGYGIPSEPASQPPSTLPRDRTELGWNPSPGPARPRTPWARTPRPPARPYKSTSPLPESPRACAAASRKP